VIVQNAEHANIMAENHAGAAVLQETLVNSFAAGHLHRLKKKISTKTKYDGL
jgi:hypothetical protein